MELLAFQTNWPLAIAPEMAQEQGGGSKGFQQGPGCNLKLIKETQAQSKHGQMLVIGGNQR